jgi:cytochrome b561
MEADYSPKKQRSRRIWPSSSILWLEGIKQTRSAKFVYAVARRWGWSMLAGLYACACLLAAWAAGRDLPTQVQMAFVICGLSLFVLAFFRYFFGIADMTPAEKHEEITRLQRPPRHPVMIFAFILLGIISIALLIAWSVWPYQP